MQNDLEPDTVVFLGDLFDGGREWSTPHGYKKSTYSVDSRWHKYGRKFWLKEYYRFGRIFIDTWIAAQSSGRKGQQGRKIITSLPGNHDLGLGNGIRIPVRQRFNAYFGDGNRVDIIGNHSFISLDTVSLSAKGQVNSDPQHPAAVDDSVTRAIWQPTDDFLAEVKDLKARATKRDLLDRFGRPESHLRPHDVVDIVDPRSSEDEISKRASSSQLPSVLLTHVPLYRTPGTPCGPLRERFPPSKEAKKVDEEIKDDANAIRVAAGVQYQNVLTPSISDQIIEKVGDVEYAFSGDDHDYCNVLHRGYTSRSGGVREITVKSMSWAMGVRKPGVLLVSLWNPVDDEGVPMKSSRGSSISEPQKQTSGTIQTHLCLLPDQLLIFIRYAFLLGITMVAILVEAVVVVLRGGKSVHEPEDELLPMIETSGPSAASASAWSSHPGEVSRSDSPASASTNGLSSRSSGRSRASSALRAYGIQVPESTAKPMHGGKKTTTGRNRSNTTDILYRDLHRLRSPSRIADIFSMIGRSIKFVVCIVFPFYIYLIWRS